MKRITEEQAERIPQRLGIRKHLNKINDSKCNQVRSGWKHYDHHRIHTWNHISRFIAKYIGKKWDDCYSDFLKWISSDRKLKAEKQHLLYQFKEKFANFESRAYKKLCNFEINSEGIIKPSENFYRKRNRTPVYKEYIYKFVPSDSPYEYYRKSEFIRKLGSDIYNECLKGISYERFLELANKEPSLTWKLKKIPVGEPITDKREISRYFYEAISKSRKAHRVWAYKRQKELEALSFGSFCTRREEKKLLKKLALEKAKEEEAFNIVERDRLGFNEESFKTPQKFK